MGMTFCLQFTIHLQLKNRRGSIKLKIEVQKMRKIMRSTFEELR